MAVFAEFDCVPAAFLCPLSGQLMRDPVVAPNGASIDRSMIERWKATYHCSLSHLGIRCDAEFRVNRSLKNAIDEYLSEKGEPQAAPPPPPTTITSTRWAESPELQARTLRAVEAAAVGAPADVAAVAEVFGDLRLNAPSWTPPPTLVKTAAARCRWRAWPGLRLGMYKALAMHIYRCDVRDLPLLTDEQRAEAKRLFDVASNNPDWLTEADIIREAIVLKRHRDAQPPQQ